MAPQVCTRPSNNLHKDRYMHTKAKTVPVRAYTRFRNGKTEYVCKHLRSLPR